ncbi:hypothetical protein HMPREF0791_1725 [Staphylococcus epidermidis W23144]|nr:hypothetical protein HMPREF0791_1725 [Staphylococcus epidermidis W23144]OXE85078.1 hypothetical protein ATC33_06325 [Staphylococcus epidermidis]
MNKLNGEISMKELEKVLKNLHISEDVKRTVQSMNKDGMQLLNDYYDENSNLYQRAQLETIANEFYADPNIIKKLY